MSLRFVFGSLFVSYIMLSLRDAFHTSVTIYNNCLVSQSVSLIT